MKRPTSIRKQPATQWGNWLGWLVAVLAGLGAAAAEGSVPVPLTGWLDKTIVPKSEASPPGGTTWVNSYIWSNLGWGLYEEGTAGSQAGSGLPSSGLLTSAMGGQATFQLQSYSGGNNVAYVPQSSSETLTLASPEQLKTMQFLDFAGGATTWNVVLHFVGGGSDTLSTSTTDWLAGGAAAANLGIISQGGGYFGSGSGRIQLQETDLTVPLGDQSSLIQSVTIQNTGGGQLEVLALAADVIVPEPSTLLLLGVGGLALLWGRPRPRRCP